MNQKTDRTITMERQGAAGNAGAGASTDVIIIGGGIAGLSAGCYAQMNGLSSRIFELHSLPGGLCTSWKRKGYTFDYCIHWLVGSTPGHGFHEVWEQLGMVQGRTFIDPEVFSQIEGSDGRKIVFYTDPDRLEEHLTGLFPADRSAIAEMCRTIRTLSGFRMADFSLKPKYWGRLLRALPSFGLMRRLTPFTMKEYAQRFTDPWLRDVIASFFGSENMPVIGFLMTMGWMHAGVAGYPIGGSYPMSKAVADRYRSLGGSISYNSRVARILSEGGKAYGVRLEDGSEHTARWVISAADAYATFRQMLEDRYHEPKWEEYFSRKELFPSLIQISLGIDGSLDVPQTVTWQMSRPLTVDPGDGVSPNTTLTLGLHHYGFDPTLAPEGKTAAVVRMGGTPQYWRNLAQIDPAQYEKEKERILGDVIERLEERFPGIRERIEVTDVSTPWTAERYTGNWDGCMEGWLITPESLAESMKGSVLPTEVPGLANFLLAGQWTVPGGGLPPSAQSGRDAIKKICRAEGRRFRTSVASPKASTALARG